ncbi:UNVERIFIED_CONTAM: ncs1 [Trichonephila clavipes]
MTKEEFKHIYGQFFPSGDPTRFVDYVFNVFDIDKDRDGKLSREEFCKGFKNDAWIIKALLMKSPVVSASSNSLNTTGGDNEVPRRTSTCQASVGNGLH